MKEKLLLVFLFCFCAYAGAMAQSRTVRGKVTSSTDGAGLATVTVQVKGGNVTTQTDANGDYAINVSGGETLVFSYVGFVSAEEPVGDRSVINVSLAMDLQQIEEVIVTGVAGATDRRKLTVSVTKVNADKLNIVPATSAATALSGKVAGLKTSGVRGTPGAAADMLLRGDNNLNVGSGPLILVDGTILSGTLADINVDDVESIEVVKGAAAAALYGSRAGNGVISVITKRGKGIALNSTKITVRNELGAENLAKYLKTSESHYYELADDWETAKGKYTKYKAAGYPADYMGQGYDPRITGKRDPDPDGYMDNPYGVYRDEQKEFFRTGTSMTNFISVANRSENNNVYLSFENNQQDGVVRFADGYKRQNFRFNIDQQLTSWFKVSATNLFVNRSIGAPSENALFYNIARLEKDVTLSAPNPDGQPYYVRFNQWNEETVNPMYTMWKQKTQNNTRRWMSNFSGNINFTSWANLDLSHSMEIINQRTGTINPMDTWQRSGGTVETNGMSYTGGNMSQGSNETKANNTQITLNLSEKFGDLSARAKLSYLYENRHYESSSLSGSQFVVTDIENLNNFQTGNTNTGSYLDDERAQNYFAIVGLDWKDKLLFDGMYRYDGSSLFGPDARWNSYYRLSGAYRISEDVSINGIDELKIRAAYGTAGIRPSFAWQYEVYSLSAGNTSASQKGNTFLKPSTTREAEVGLNVEFLRKFNFEATYANSVTDDQFLNIPLIPFLNDGFSSQWQNAGSIESNTFEFSLGANWIRKENFAWNTNIVFSKGSQKITSLPRAPYMTSGQQTNGDQNMFYIKEGEVYGAMYGRKHVRSLEELGQQPLPAGKTISDFEVNSDGYVVPKGSQGTLAELPVLKLEADGAAWFGRIGKGTPDFVAGIANTINWKGVQLYVLLDWKQGGDVYNGKDQRLAFNWVSAKQDMTNVPDGQKKAAIYWGSNGGFYDGNNGNAYWVEDGTYMKVREISIGYSLPTRMLGKHVKGVTGRVIGRNLLTFTNYSGYDPEVGSLRFPVDGIYTNPIYRNVAFSLSLDF